MPKTSRLSLTLALLATLVPAGAMAQGPWGEPGWGGPGPRHGGWPAEAAPDPSSDVSVSVFRAVGAEGVLGHGTLRIVAMPEGLETNPDMPSGTPASEEGASSAPPAPPPMHAGDPFLLEGTIFRDAVAARLGHDGYTIIPPGDGAAAGQILELRVTHGMVAPGDPPHKTVSGEASMGVSNYGSGMSLGINIDLSKPRGPVVSTRVEVRIRDAATGRALWEGHAEMAAREGDSHWPDVKIAARLAAALFDRFPQRVGDRRGRH